MGILPGKRKGKQRERECSELYERAGYLTFRPQESKWGETDMFGLFDLVAVHRTRKTRWVQVKSNGATGIRRWRTAAQPFMGPHNTAEYAVPYDREGWRLVRPEPGRDSHTTIFDGRDSNHDMGEGLLAYLLEGDDGG